MDKASRWENYTADAKISLAAFLSHGASSFGKENCLYQGFQRQILGNFYFMRKYVEASWGATSDYQVWNPLVTKPFTPLAWPYMVL